MVRRRERMTVRLWDIQIAPNPWFSIGVHLDHTDPSITLHLPGFIIYAGHCKWPGMAGWSLRQRGHTAVYEVQE